MKNLEIVSKALFMKKILVILFSFILAIIAYYIWIKFVLNISFQNAISLIVIGFVGFIIGSIYFLKKYKNK
jgi:hypothetical protein